MNTSSQKDLDDRIFWIANEEEIKAAKTTDVYFHYALEVLKKIAVDPKVVMEAYVRTVPYPEQWGVVTGIYEVAKLFEGKPVNIMAMDEGEIFLTDSSSIVYEPIMQIEGLYSEICLYENPLLGLLSSSTSISTKAARVRMAAGDKPLFSFGTRRVHPALAPMVERACYIGGFDSVSNVLGAMLMKKKPVGTMPHSLIQCIGDQREAWRAFDKALPEDVPRIALIDTFFDEKSEAMMALETLGSRLYGVRMDTPRSRRGDWRKIVEEVRWELNLRSGKHVKIYLSGGLDEENIRGLQDLVDGFGVGTNVSAAPIIDFSLKIVEMEIDGKSVYRAKRGDIGGAKRAFRNDDTYEDLVIQAHQRIPEGRRGLLTELIKKGRITRQFKTVDEIHQIVLQKLKKLASTRPRLIWR